MLTRSKARAIARQHAADQSVLVSPSATGKGTHIRWTYPEDNTGRNPHRRYRVDLTATYPFSESLSSISSHSSSSGEEPLPVTPDNSFGAPSPAPFTPQQNHRPLTTPPRLSPKKLQRSPGRCRWVTQDGVTRVVLSEESVEGATLRDIQTDIRLSHIAERELEILLREREAAHGSVDIMFDMDMDTEASGSWIDQASNVDVSETGLEDGEASGSGVGLASAAYIREEAEPAQEAPSMAGPSKRARPLGPEGTELVDPITFRPYSMESTGISSIEAWRHGFY
ncbi:hypothetical protein DXG01_008941 [Tephrocybe rancida]|nr:hypothetical protein DXG01_008941 [Tephrocybe rancida]